LPKWTERAPPKIIGTKQTIAGAILLYQVLRGRKVDNLSEIEKSFRFATKRAAEDDFRSSRDAFFFGLMPTVDPLSAAPGYLARELRLSDSDFERAVERTTEILNYLEQNGLAVDPIGTPELMVLVGFIPMHFSVRTKKGEKLYREFKLNAPYWRLGWTWGDGRLVELDADLQVVLVVRKLLEVFGQSAAEEDRRARDRYDLPNTRETPLPRLDTDDH
jgi:hypothetical protein